MPPAALARAAAAGQVGLVQVELPMHDIVHRTGRSLGKLSRGNSVSPDARSRPYSQPSVAEDIITELSVHPDLFVVARNSSFAFRGKARARVYGDARTSSPTNDVLGMDEPIFALRRRFE